MKGTADRAELLAFLRGEIVGPAVPFAEAVQIRFVDGVFHDDVARRRGALCWTPTTGDRPQEVLYYDREQPVRKYGVGLLHPQSLRADAGGEVMPREDHLGFDPSDESAVDPVDAPSDEEAPAESGDEAPQQDFDITSPDVRHPSCMGLSCCVLLPLEGALIIRLPQHWRFGWQADEQPDFPVNGRYERCFRSYAEEGGEARSDPAWRRHPAVAPETIVRIGAGELATGPVRRNVPLPAGSPIRLRIEAFARPVRNVADGLLVTVVLRNITGPSDGPESHAILYQTHFTLEVEGGRVLPYPERDSSIQALDQDEESLGLLYRESPVWAIGHGCAAGWEMSSEAEASYLFIDVLPAVETPSMTPNITNADGRPLTLKMHDLAQLTEDGSGRAWSDLSALVTEYRAWIEGCVALIESLPQRMQPAATRHMTACRECLGRIEDGLDLLRGDPLARKAFRLANRAMLLQQIATKKLKHRPLQWDPTQSRPRPEGDSLFPDSLYDARGRALEGIGTWRAFQIAFLLMELRSTAEDTSANRATVDLIWFPTGGGKTEAYLGVMAFYMFYNRLTAPGGPGQLASDGTNVIMRYTLRMLTSQQFQRAASLVTAMEFMRRRPQWHSEGTIPGARFSVGLWIGSDGTPNNEAKAREAFSRYQSDGSGASPFVLTECPWCRSQIGAVKPPGRRQRTWAIAGVTRDGQLHCPDGSCEFGQQPKATWLPVEVVDTQIYDTRPSLVIGTADKFAMLAYRPQAGRLFGLDSPAGGLVRTHRPPGLIVQDELHLIAGPLGTLYGLYEAVIEMLCMVGMDGAPPPKLIASTATIRGASDQVRSIYARVQDDGSTDLQLFPPPGLTMGDSFFGVYARNPDGSLAPGRLYVGIHASEYGSILTAQVRSFAAALAKAGDLPDDEGRDPWWTLLTFYNSLRELGGGKTLFDSDIRSRMKFIQNREGTPDERRRRLMPAEELTSRLLQSEIVGMMDKLSTPYPPPEGRRTVDACLASSIIEVGVDIDRLSLMGVVGQPKTTAQYIQVTGRVGRRWQSRPGLVLTLYSPARSRDRSHFEQFHTYHRRLYERVEPTSATPFSPSAIARGLAGVLLSWARQHVTVAAAPNAAELLPAIASIRTVIEDRCRAVQRQEDHPRSLAEVNRVFAALTDRIAAQPELWEEYPPATDRHYLMLWPGEYYDFVQRQRGMPVPSSMRQVDGTAELRITQFYELSRGPATTGDDP